MVFIAADRVFDSFTSTGVYIRRVQRLLRVYQAKYGRYKELLAFAAKRFILVNRAGRRHHVYPLHPVGYRADAVLYRNPVLYRI